MVINCTQEKKFGAPSCPVSTGEGQLVLNCFHDKGSGALLFSGEGSGALLFSEEGNWCTTDLRRRKLVLYCF